MNKDKSGMINKYIIDSKQFNITVLPPHINKSEMNFSVNDDKILFGLSAIAGIGEKAALPILQERQTNGKYKNFENLLSRVNLSKSQIISLIKSGAIPTRDKKQCSIKYLESGYSQSEFTPVKTLPPYTKIILDYDIDLEQYRLGDKKYDYDKDRLLAEINKLKYIEHIKKQEIKHQKYMEDNKKYLDDEPYWEFETLQVFIHDNPFEESVKYLTNQFEDVEIGNECVIIGIISSVQKKKDKNKNQFAFINIYSTCGLVEGTVWSSQLRQYEDLIKKGSQIVIKCRKDDEDKVVVQDVKSYNQWLKEREKIHG